ncbi:Energy-coupling factor transporter ATP-binding protein EcfA2 [Granulicatella balaenopterae]|uniref:Energy-coupling factor transporter ATP-binding protein EcfA2 n=1 Tax=Granulicatella balaenopterae TaxID=137733 RepID=A0A1H9IZ80_9LACT|nr:ABC transporter ATP-binding protein [Granulicatella balaenopterae]SEQ79828.1 Energy-coupling factor transporter ATP-binding protein EcfA2 [Granulicatella balaenopterae]
MLECKNISIRYQERLLVKDVTLSAKPGEVIVLTGKSGSGKSSLLKLINGLIPEVQQATITGELTYKGENVLEKDIEERSQFVSTVFQNPKTQFYCINTTDELAFALENQALPVEEIWERVHHYAKLLNTDKLLNRDIFCLSGGEKQLIAITSVVCMENEVYLFDEPSSSLDPQAINWLRNTIKLLKDMGKIVIIAEHRLYYLKELIDQLWIIDHGQVKSYQKEDLVETLLEELANQYQLRSFTSCQEQALASHKHQVIHLLNKETIVIHSELADVRDVVAVTGNAVNEQDRLADARKVVDEQDRLADARKVVDEQDRLVSRENEKAVLENATTPLDKIADANTCTVSSKKASDQLKPIPTIVTTNTLANKQITHNSPQLTCQHYYIQYGKQKVMDCSLQFSKGTYFITGENGVGKTSFIRKLCQLAKFPGKTYFGGELIKQSYDYLSLVMQDVNYQLFTESVWQELSLASDDQAEKEQILKKLELWDKKDFHPQILSGGEKQRLLFAMALVSHKPLIILDEPTSGLDRIQMTRIAQYLQTLQASGKLVLVITHDYELIDECRGTILEFKR